jgi:hypothetical protein
MSKERGYAGRTSPSEIGVAGRGILEADALDGLTMDAVAQSVRVRGLPCAGASTTGRTVSRAFLTRPPNSPPDWTLPPRRSSRKLFALDGERLSSIRRRLSDAVRSAFAPVVEDLPRCREHGDRRRFSPGREVDARSSSASRRSYRRLKGEPGQQRKLDTRPATDRARFRKPHAVQFARGACRYSASTGLQRGAACAAISGREPIRSFASFANLRARQRPPVRGTTSQRAGPVPRARRSTLRCRTEPARERQPRGMRGGPGGA